MSDFVIENGVLIKYTGHATDVVLPENVTSLGKEAFKYCRHLISVNIPHGVTSIGESAFHGCSQLVSVMLPNSLISIEKAAFLDCRSLMSISIPQSVVSIGDYAFYKCSSLESLTIPDGMTAIGQWVFNECRQLQSITIPNGIVCIGPNAFDGCDNLKTVKIPASVTRIDRCAFRGCSHLTSIELPPAIDCICFETFAGCSSLTHVLVPESVGKIEDRAFLDCPQLKYLQLPSPLVVVSADSFDLSCRISFASVNALCNKKKLPDGYTQLTFDFLVEDNVYASILLNQKSEAWQKWVSRYSSNHTNVLRNCETLLAKRKELTADTANRIEAYMHTHAKKLSPQSIASMLDLLEKKGAQPNRKPFQKIILAAPQQSQQTNNPHDAFIAERIQNYDFAEEAVVAIKPNTKVHRKDSDALASPAELRYILSEFVRLYHKCKRTESSAMGTVDKLVFGTVVTYQMTPEVTRIVEQLDRKELDALLNKLAHGSKYRSYILAYGALATDDEVKLIADEIIQKRKGVAKERYWAEHMEYALYLNSEHQAMLFFDRIGELGSYAKWRFNTTEQQLRDTYMMPQFGFDADGIKRYDIGGNIIEVSIAPDLSCQLYDTKNKKILRSMPKKSDDPEKAAACASDYAAFKKSIKDFYTQRMQNMHRLHIEGTWIEADSWRRVYIDHPVVKLAARLLVWQDEKGKTFTPTANGIIGINGEVYEPVGRIQLAHVLSLPPEEVSAWQDYYASNHLQQPFAQVWEPVIPWNQEQTVTRYKNKLLTRANRNTLKKALEFAGISMRSEVEDFGYNYREGKHEFANHGQLHFDQFFALEFELYDGDLLLGDGLVSLCRKKPSANVLRGMNAVFSQLDFAIARDAAAGLSEAELAKLDLTHFTLAQINELINIATTNKSTACTAYLLNLKNERFPQYNALDHLVLDW